MYTQQCFDVHVVISQSAKDVVLCMIGLLMLFMLEWLNFPLMEELRSHIRAEFILQSTQYRGVLISGSLE